MKEKRAAITICRKLHKMYLSIYSGKKVPAEPYLAL